MSAPTAIIHEPYSQRQRIKHFCYLFWNDLSPFCVEERPELFQDGPCVEANRAVDLACSPIRTTDAFRFFAHESFQHPVLPVDVRC